MSIETIIATNSEILDIGIIPESIKVMSFQGEMSRVLSAESRTFGQVIIKTAITESGIQIAGVEEIDKNVQGYKFIPSKFQPEILLIDQEKTIMVMKNAGVPLRDLLWNNQHDQPTCDLIIRDLQRNLTDLVLQTKKVDVRLECSVYLKEIKSIGNLFLEGEFFPEKLRTGFNALFIKALSVKESVGAFASIDSTQGNLLIDNSLNPSTLKLIDPKQPRVVNDIPNFIGIPEVDLGMFLVTVELNSPDVLKRLNLENMLVEVGKSIHSEKDSKLYLDLGRVFGCILIARFPNTLDRVEKYLRSFGVEPNAQQKEFIATERERHIEKALGILRKYEKG